MSYKFAIDNSTFGYLHGVRFGTLDPSSFGVNAQVYYTLPMWSLSRRRMACDLLACVGMTDNSDWLETRGYLVYIGVAREWLGWPKPLQFFSGDLIWGKIFSISHNYLQCKSLKEKVVS